MSSSFILIFDGMPSTVQPIAGPGWRASIGRSNVRHDPQSWWPTPPECFIGRYYRSRGCINVLLPNFLTEGGAPAPPFLIQIFATQITRGQMREICALCFRIALYFMPRLPFSAHISCRDMSGVLVSPPRPKMTASHFCLACSVSV